jgi:exopolysaccharide biosynthesis polyprenyl glycosylphosphotransferase
VFLVRTEATDIGRSLVPEETSGWRSWARALAPAALAGGLVYRLASPGSDRLGLAVVVCLAVTWAYRSALAHLAAHARFLALMRVVAPVVAPLVAFLALTALDLTSLLPLSLAQVAMICGLVALVGALVAIVIAEPKRLPLRVGVVGSAVTAADLSAELAAQRNSSVVVVGCIASDHQPARSPGGGTSPIGTLSELERIVIEHRLDLLLLSPSVPRMRFFDVMEATCSHLPVRVIELASFYEKTFGHVPLRAINSAWFQWVMHPNYSPGTPLAKRVFDVCIASLLTLITSPLIAVLALLVKLDGGPAFYRQIRIGEGGKPFEILKLRSMRVADDDVPARWSAEDDNRITPLGAFLRRTHLDEIPQLLNVLTGDMSIVGPRPEQPSFVESLEESVAFYSRRHVVRPGITGWAQVRCGYAGSHEGTLWKLSHDLYYLKHRSPAFDLLILGETFHMLFADRQFPSEFSLPTFVQHAAGPVPRES